MSVCLCVCERTATAKARAPHTFLESAPTVHCGTHLGSHNRRSHTMCKKILQCSLTRTRLCPSTLCDVTEGFVTALFSSLGRRQLFLRYFNVSLCPPFYPEIFCQVAFNRWWNPDSPRTLCAMCMTLEVFRSSFMFLLSIVFVLFQTHVEASTKNQRRLTLGVCAGFEIFR